MDTVRLDLKREALKQVLARPLGWTAAAIRGAERGAWPVLDLVVRLWLAQVFFVSGVLKAANWENALNLAANEYPVSWLDPVTAAWLGVTIEIGGAVLLAHGFGDPCGGDGHADPVAGDSVQLPRIRCAPVLGCAVRVVRGVRRRSHLAGSIAGARTGRQRAAARGQRLAHHAARERLGGSGLPAVATSCGWRSRCSPRQGQASRG